MYKSNHQTSKRGVNREKANEKKIQDVKAQLSDVIAKTKESGDHSQLEQLEGLLDNLQEVQQANCSPIIFDQCVLDFPANSILGGGGDDYPPFIVGVLNDPFFLECCVTPTQVSASTPCGDVDGVTVNEVKAIGYLNYYFSFELDTFFNNGAQNCSAVNRLPFSCTGTTCVNDVISYTSTDDPDPCPDFCNGEVFSFAFLCDVCVTDNKTTAIYTVVHFLTNPNEDNE
ncbi:hypothetical protein [Virgibacillus ihumii]|uniref:hypothetical protein n=1 Tax=Virgibacillus ihumii TaxID=2686091 RepID=UPI00157CED01|nr:hypothetical protein [Virgibacillus ihumii]